MLVEKYLVVGRKIFQFMEQQIKKKHEIIKVGIEKNGYLLLIKLKKINLLIR